MINAIIRIYYFIFDRVFSPAVWWLMVNIVWFEWPRKEQPEMGVTKELWFRDPYLSPEPIKGIYECQIDRPDYTVDLYKVWIDKLPNGTPYCGHEWVRIVDILGYEEPVEEEGPCLRCGGDGYIEVGFEQFQNCSDECVSRALGETAAIRKRHAEQELEAWMGSECPYCSKVQRNCQCTDIGFS